MARFIQRCNISIQYANLGIVWNCLTILFKDVTANAYQHYLSRTLQIDNYFAVKRRRTVTSMCAARLDPSVGKGNIAVKHLQKYTRTLVPRYCRYDNLYGHNWPRSLHVVSVMRFLLQRSGRNLKKIVISDMHSYNFMSTRIIIIIIIIII